MKAIQEYINSKEYEFNNHPFFKILEQFDTLQGINHFAPKHTFWTMTFQDILRINEERVQDPYLKKIARHHRLEDAGHDKWFLHDKEYMNESASQGVKENQDIAWLYSKDLQATRDPVYAIVSEIYKIDDEYLNIILLLTLESAGHVFLEKIAEQVKKIGEDENLLFFSSSHLDVEMAHTFHEEEITRTLFEKELSVISRENSVKMIDRCYDAFNQLLSSTC